MTTLERASLSVTQQDLDNFSNNVPGTEFPKLIDAATTQAEIDQFCRDLEYQAEQGRGVFRHASAHRQGNSTYLFITISFRTM